MNASRLALCALGLGALLGCSQNPGPAKDQVIATVNGKPVLRNTFEQYAEGVANKPVSELTIQQRDVLLDNLVRAAVLADEAERSGLADRPEVAGALDIQRLVILERASAENYMKDRAPSEEEMRAEYDLRVKELDKLQYRLAHIQVDSQEAAATLIAQISQGGNFATLARQQSKDSTSATQGGELPWSTPSGMPASFATAVREMKVGETFRTPLRTDIGWHVVRMLESRDYVPPPYESVQQELAEAVQEKRFKAFTDSLVEKAKVTKSP